MQKQQVILAVCLAIANTLTAQKLVTIGDSQTANCGWQPYVVEETGYEWSREETTTGIHGHRAMAVGGTWMRPNNTASISLRGRDAMFYEPEKVIIYAGQNDNWYYWRNSENTGATPLEQVAWEEAYSVDEVNTSVSTISAFKGLIEHLQEQCPEAQLYLMTHVPVLCVVGMDPDSTFAQYYPSPRFKDMEDVLKFEKYNREPKDEIIRALGQYYDLPVIDLWKYSGITYYNTAHFYGKPAGDCTQVHLNRAGEHLIANCIADYLLNAPLEYDPDWVPASYDEVASGVTIHAEDYGVSTQATATNNCRFLNEALANGGHVVLTTPGTYEIAGTVYLTSNTTLEFGEGVKLVRQAKWSDCMHQLFLNRGAQERVYDHDITIRGLNLDVNNLRGPIDDDKMIKGLQSVMGFFYVKNLCIEDLTLENLPNSSFGLQVCTFDSLLIDRARIEGQKDGIHLGRGSHYTIRNCEIGTSDDPIALNGHDYVISNPELGWIEDGCIENCTDLNSYKNVGFFCRMLAGSWCDWQEGMEFRYGDAVVSEGRIYRLMNEQDTLISTLQPCHLAGEQTYDDGCVWYMQQDQDVCYNAGVRNLHFDNITLQKSRDTAFSFHYDKGRYSRSFYPGAESVTQTGITFDHIQQQAPFTLLMAVTTPVDTIRIENSTLGQGKISMRNIATEGCVYDTTVVMLKNVELPSVDDLLSPNREHPCKLITDSIIASQPVIWYDQQSHIYQIDGQRMPNDEPTVLPRGLYIIDGKKKYYTR